MVAGGERKRVADMSGETVVIYLVKPQLHNTWAMHKRGLAAFNCEPVHACLVPCSGFRCPFVVVAIQPLPCLIQNSQSPKRLFPKPFSSTTGTSTSTEKQAACANSITSKKKR